MPNPFQILGLEPSFQIAPAVLDQAYFQAQRAWHPDQHIHASEEVQEQARQNAAHANQAYHTLKNPLKRAEALLKIQGLEDPHHPVSPDLAGEAFEWREQLEDLEGDMEGLRQLKHKARTAYQEACDAFGRLWAQNAPTAALSITFQRMAFLIKCLQTCEDLLLSPPSSLD